MTGPRLSLERIARAATVIDPVFLDSPQFLAEALGRDLGCRLLVKVETVNPIRSFKGRGTEYVTAPLEAKPRLVCSTAGNFGQGMAWSARKRGLPITVFTNVAANPVKVERMRALGADVRLVGKDVEEAHEAANEFAAATGARIVEDGRDPEIAEGAGTIGRELLRWPEPFDAVVVPVGDVEDGAIVSAIRRAHADLGLVLEPAGAAGLAALSAHRERFRGQLVATVLSGGNATAEQLRQWL